tara:strand:+ start:3210 stop:3428 length:219 start_codon:yes stop_codon:yes gene_type:complete
MREPNEPHDEWGRPLKITNNKYKFFDKLRDVFFYTFVGIIFIVIFGWILIVFLPFYLGREIWQRFELWYINK